VRSWKIEIKIKSLSMGVRVPMLSDERKQMRFGSGETARTR